MNIGEGVYVMHDESKLEHHAYDIKTGNRLWTSDPNPTGWGIFTYQQHIANGKLYTTGYEGDVRAYDIETGELDWTYYLGNAGIETPYGTWPTYNGFTIADGKIFVGADEHSPNSVLWRGAKLWAIDAETGDGIWSISGMFRNPAISDGILTSLNSYDGQVYTFGKGPSKTTVSAPDTEVPKGKSVLIKGSVLDMSPAQPNTPCISDNDMSAWMEYQHMQKQRPIDVTGVPVKLVYQLPDGSWKDIDQVISDDHGNFGFKWTPEEEGTYLVKAFFLGSKSYGSSSATTYLTVGPPEEFPDVPTAEEIAADAAQRTINMLPPYPDVPTQEQIAHDAATRTIAMLPQYPAPPEPTVIPAYQTIDLVIIILVVIAIIIGLYGIVKKQK